MKPIRATPTFVTVKRHPVIGRFCFACTRC
jgi:hypothetical protein